MINILGEKDARGVNVNAILVFLYVFCFFLCGVSCVFLCVGLCGGFVFQA